MSERARPRALVLSALAVVAIVALVWRIRVAQRTDANTLPREGTGEASSVTGAAGPPSVSRPPSLSPVSSAAPFRAPPGPPIQTAVADPSPMGAAMPTVPAAEIAATVDRTLMRAAAPCVTDRNPAIESQRITAFYTIVVSGEIAYVQDVQQMPTQAEPSLEACILDRFRSVSWSAPRAPDFSEKRQISFRVGDLVTGGGE